MDIALSINVCGTDFSEHIRCKDSKIINLYMILTVLLLQPLQVRAGPSRCGAQFKTWVWGPMQDLSAGLF